MAWYDGKANAGHGRVFFNDEGREHAVVGYAKTHNYVATSSEQVSEYRKRIGRIEPFEDHGIRDKSIHMPWRQSSAHDQPLKNDGFYPKVHDHVDHGQNYMGPPWKKGVSELSGSVVPDQSKGSPWNRGASDLSRPAVYNQRKDSPRSKDASNPNRHVTHDQNKGLLRNKDAKDPSQFSIYDQNKGSPRSKDVYESSRFMSSPSKDRYYNEFSDDEEDVICEDGVYYKKGGPKPINHFELPHNGNAKDKHSSRVPSYTVPITTPPTKDPYYEPSTHNNNRPIVNSHKPIKTRSDPDFLKENPRNSPVSIGMQQPQYNGSPRKDYGYEQSVYNKASPRAGAYARDRYKGITINAKEAAKKYNGVLLPN